MVGETVEDAAPSPRLRTPPLTLTHKKPPARLWDHPVKSTRLGASRGPVLEGELGDTGEHQHPLVLRLVVPEALGRTMATGDDPLDADAMALLENRGEFLGEVFGDVGHDIRHHRVIDINKPW
jgi:hypothetical protein